MSLETDNMKRLTDDNHQATKTQGELCMNEIMEILKKYNCELICEPKKIYGQTVFVPVVNEK